MKFPLPQNSFLPVVCYIQTIVLSCFTYFLERQIASSGLIFPTQIKDLNFGGEEFGFLSGQRSVCLLNKTNFFAETIAKHAINLCRFRYSVLPETAVFI